MLVRLAMIVLLDAATTASAPGPTMHAESAVTFKPLDSTSREDASSCSAEERQTHVAAAMTKKGRTARHS
jgi:hypothetical protein